MSISKDSSANKSLTTQIAKYGGVEGYKAEMRRRRKLVKKPGFASMPRDKVVEIAKKRHATNDSGTSTAKEKL